MLSGGAAQADRPIPSAEVTRRISAITIEFGLNNSFSPTPSVNSFPLSPGDRGVEKPRLGEPHAPLGFRPEHTRMPPRPHGRGVLRRRTKAANRGVLTPQNARVGRPAWNIAAGMGFTKSNCASDEGCVTHRETKAADHAWRRDALVTASELSAPQARLWRPARALSAPLFSGYVSATVAAGGRRQSSLSTSRRPRRAAENLAQRPPAPAQWPFAGAPRRPELRGRSDPCIVRLKRG